MAMYVDAAGELSPMLFEVGFGPAQRKEREERRFHDLLVEEKSRFHSVSLSEEQPANYTPPFYYQPLPLPNEYDPTMFISNPTRGLARLIPQDGRIELAFDLHWQAKKDEHKWKMSPLRDYGFDDDGCLKYLQEQAEPRIKSLNSFGEEIQTFGNFFIWDADPSKPTNGHVLYNLGCSEPYFDIPEESNRGNQIREMTKFDPITLLRSYNCQSDLC
ncbi:hypothetical protein N431DRAFT_101882 [Stipitochalara longipes BDJ]|nr:hypothetical protein N431DRAFT_101882 [Stipitochalara longipes BDJ]